MPTIRREQLFHEEERLKDKVYKTFDSLSQEATSSVDSTMSNVNKEGYEDQIAFVAYGQLSEARQKKYDVERLIGFGRLTENLFALV